MGITERKEWKFFSVLPKASAGLAAAWWAGLLLRGVLPAAFAVAMGLLVGDVKSGQALASSLALVGAIFVLLQVLSPIHQAAGNNLGDRTAAWLYDRLTEACVRPPGIGHLEDPALTSDLTVARDFDLGMTGPPLSISMDFIANGLVEMIGGIACAAILFGYSWWAPLVLAGAWLATHWLLRESAVWRDRNTEEVRGAQRDADYTYRLAVDPPASKELRLFGLSSWVIQRFRERRTQLHELQYAATRLRERPVIWSMLLVVAANVLVFWSIASAAANAHISLGAAVTFAQSAIGVSMIAFGGFSWALDGASAPVDAVLRLGDAMQRGGELPMGNQSAAGKPSREVRLWGRTAPERRRLRSCCAACTIRNRARLKLTVWICANSISRRGDRESRRCSRISSGSSCRCETTWLRVALRTTWFARRWNRPARQTWPGWIRCWRAVIREGPICREGNGNGWRWRGRLPRCGQAPGWCC